MFGMKKKPVEQRRPSWVERVRGRLGYSEDIEGKSSLEFMEELAPPAGLHRFRKMRMNDPIVGGLLVQIENIVRRFTWDLEGPNASKVKTMLSSMHKGMSWFNYELSSSFCYGFYLGEKIWSMEGSTLVLQDISPRFQPSIEAIDDKNGNVIQETLSGRFEIPYKKCVHHMFFSENRAPFGLSILRHLYKPYYYKVSVEASESVSIDRDLSGLPVISAPEGFNFERTDPESPDYDPAAEATLNWALDIVSNIRNDNMTGVVKPSGWVLEIIRGENRTSIPTSEIISRYNTEMAAGVLENFLALGGFASTNNANTEVNVKNFLRACDAYAEVIADTINNQVIDDICRYNNWDKPTFKFTPVNTAALEDLASFFGRLVSRRVITPTTTLEKELLNIAGFSFDTNPGNQKSIPENG